MNPVAGGSFHKLAMSDRKVFALYSHMVNYLGEYVGSGFNQTHDWFETHSPWVAAREDLQPILDQLSNINHPVWYETQSCTFRTRLGEEFRLRLRFRNLDDALLVKLGVDV